MERPLLRSSERVRVARPEAGPENCAIPATSWSTPFNPFKIQIRYLLSVLLCDNGTAVAFALIENFQAMISSWDLIIAIRSAERR